MSDDCLRCGCLESLHIWPGGACAACDCAGFVGERNDAREKLAKVRQELAATLECDCGTCLACRVADVVGV